MKYKFLDWLFKFIKTGTFGILQTLFIWYLIYLTLPDYNLKEMHILHLLGFLFFPILYFVTLARDKSCHCNGILRIKNDAKYYSQYKCVKCATAYYSQKWWIEGYNKDEVDEEIKQASEKHKSATPVFYYFED